MKQLGLLAARSVFTAFQLLTALYCLLAYLPFTYHQVHAGGLLPLLDQFVRIHPWLNLGMLAVLIPLMAAPWQGGGFARWLTLGFAVYQTATACALVLHPVLESLENNSSSLSWSLLALVPVVWLAWIDLAAYAGQVQWAAQTAGRGPSYYAAWRGALFVSLLYAAICLLRRPGGLALPEEASAAGWSLLVHLLLFLGAFLLLECLTGLAGVWRHPARVEFWLCHLLLAGGIAGMLRVVVWPSLGFNGWAQIAVSVAFGFSLALTNAGIALWLAAGRPVADGIGAAAAPATLGLVSSWRSGAAVLLVLALAGCGLAIRSAAFDWNGLLQKLSAAGIWLASFACFYSIGAAKVRVRSAAWLAAPLVLLGAYKGLEAAAPVPAPVLERWAGYDASFRLAQQFLAPPPRKQAPSFLQFLNQNTNIAASVKVAPVSIDLVPALAPAAGPLPNIFIFTIDSLRRDYLSPYNPGVHFTPAIEAFARESTVFQNAFTRYGGTGLSEPSIWAGAMLLHKQYVTPFAPMNALEKLVRTDGYQQFLTRDPILDAILEPAPGDVDLESGSEALTPDFARTLERLKQKIEQRETAGKPLFIYTQPQNLHISVIQREGASAPNNAPFEGFYAPYAWRVQQIDAAFGTFIEFLKARGLYQHSIIVLTADHGDSLGEGGRWGHAYTLFPEIVRIPLLIHLPEDLQGAVGSDPAAVAFSTDITPSLYYLLGHRPIVRNELFGTPLFAAAEAERRRDPGAQYLLASSYAAVYGILSEGGRRLYVADSVNFENYGFDLDAAGGHSVCVTAPFEQDQDQRIHDGILAIDRFYGFSGGRP